jgi:hypothetical protein
MINMDDDFDVNEAIPDNNDFFVPIGDGKVKCTACDSTWAKGTMTTSAKAGHLSSPNCSKYLKIKLCPRVPFNVSARNVKNIEANMNDKLGKRSFEEAKKSDHVSNLHKKAADLVDKSQSVGARQVIFFSYPIQVLKQFHYS